jgi:4,5-DOPA dioxygenase extradiol
MNALDDNPNTRAWAEMGRAVIARRRPRAIVMVSAHWMTRGSAITAMAHPETIHDFGAFPQALFNVRYPAPGAPEIAREVIDCLSSAGLTVTPDNDWGFDHGSWSVLVKAFPNADIPVLQLSLNRQFSPREHFALGQALRPLRDADILVAASGNVVHNLPAMNWSLPESGHDWAQRFHTVIREAIANNQPDEVVDFVKHGRDAALSIPTPEHYLPVLYALGARHEDDVLRFESERVEYGSLSMLSFSLHDAFERAPSETVR